jgi:hypothetical protein
MSYFGRLGIPTKIHCKKGYLFTIPSCDKSLTKFSLAGNDLIISGRGEFVSIIPAVDGKNYNLFLQCTYT